MLVHLTQTTSFPVIPLWYDLLFHVDFKYPTIFLQISLFFILEKFVSRKIFLYKNVNKISLKSRTGKVEMLQIFVWEGLLQCILTLTLSKNFM